MLDERLDPRPDPAIIVSESLEVLDRFVPCLLMLLKPNSHTMLFSWLDRLCAALEVLRYLLLID